MVFFNYALRKLNAKIVYYGPGLCGKTTNLQWIHNHFEGGTRGKMISLATEGDRTIFFDLLPIEIGTIRGMEVTLQLYTVPGQVHYNSTRQLVLRGADGVVFVADSQKTMRKSNQESLKNLEENLLLQGIEIKEFPHVLQFNKRDLRDLLEIEELDEDINLFSCPFFEAVATEGIGVQETLEGIVKLVMRKLRDRYEPLAPGGPRAAAAPGGLKPVVAPSPAVTPPSPAPEAVPPVEVPPPQPAEPEMPAVVAPPSEFPPFDPTAEPTPGVATEPVVPEYQPSMMAPEGTEASPGLVPEADVVAFEEPTFDDIDQDKVTTAVFDDDEDESGTDFPGFAAEVEPVVIDEAEDLVEEISAAAEIPPEQQIEHLIQETTDASTMRVDDASISDWASRLDEADDEAPATLEEPIEDAVPERYVKTGPMSKSLLEELDLAERKVAVDTPGDDGLGEPPAVGAAFDEPAEDLRPGSWQPDPEVESQPDPFAEANTDTDILFPPEEEGPDEAPATIEELSQSAELELEEVADEPEEAELLSVPVAEQPMLEEEDLEPEPVELPSPEQSEVFDELAEPPQPVVEPEPFETPAEEPFGDAGAAADAPFIDQIRAPSPFVGAPPAEEPPAEPEVDEPSPITKAIPIGGGLGAPPVAAEEPLEPWQAGEPAGLTDAFPQTTIEEPDGVTFEAPEELAELEAEEPVAEAAEDAAPSAVEELVFLEPVVPVEPPVDLLDDALVVEEEPPPVAESVAAVEPDSPPTRDDTVIVVGDDDPFSDPFFEPAEPSSAVKTEEIPLEQVSVLPVPPAQTVDVKAEGNRLALRLQGSGAIAEAGQVRELDIEVPVPGAWVGNQTVTLQLRLTLVPSKDDDVGGPGGAT